MQYGSVTDIDVENGFGELGSNSTLVCRVYYGTNDLWKRDHSVSSTSYGLNSIYGLSARYGLTRRYSFVKTLIEP